MSGGSDPRLDARGSVLILLNFGKILIMACQIFIPGEPENFPLSKVHSTKSTSQIESFKC